MTELNVSLFGSVVSNAMHLQCGVSQSSVLGPRLYCIFAKPTNEICGPHNFSHHNYADDIQVYLVIKALDNWTKYIQTPGDLGIRRWFVDGIKLNPRQDRTYYICTEISFEGIFRMLSLFGPL